MFEKMYRTAVKENADYVYCDYDFYPKKVKNKEKWYKEYKGIVDWNFIERNTQPWNKLIRRDLCNSIEMEKILPAFSDSVYVNLLLHAKKIVCINEVLYHYRVGHESTSGSYKGKILYYQEVAERAKKQKEFLDGTVYEKRLDEYFNYRYIYALLVLCIVAAVNRNEQVFDNAKTELINCKYKKNSYTKSVIKKNFGMLKAMVIVNIIPSSYHLVVVICKVVFNK